MKPIVWRRIRAGFVSVDGRFFLYRRPQWVLIDNKRSHIDNETDRDVHDSYEFEQAMAAKHFAKDLMTMRDPEEAMTDSPDRTGKV